MKPKGKPRRKAIPITAEVIQGCLLQKMPIKQIAISNGYTPGGIRVAMRRFGIPIWPWIGSRDTNGYGIFHVDASRHREKANRVAWVLHNGRAIPPGMVAMHSCDFPPCCNPAHLSSGTYRENALDAFKKGRKRSTSGQEHYRASMTKEKASKILREWPLFAGTKKEFCALHGVSYAAGLQLLAGLTWKYLAKEVNDK